MINGLVFESQAVAIAPVPNRVDIACFVGFVARRQEPHGNTTGNTLQPTLVPMTIQRWLRDQGVAAVAL